MIKHLVLYDGKCGLCQYSVQWLLQRDQNQELYFAPLEGKTAEAYLQSVNLPNGLDSIIYIRSGTEVFWYSSAILQLVKVLPFPWSWLSISWYIPRIFRDTIYKWIASKRLYFFGPADACRLPTPQEFSRFLP
jgi:predicted DCC family thiol-disulfide oxidoreductase YuxK